MASGPVYSVSFRGTTRNYYDDVSADAGENLRQFGELVEDFKALGLTLGSCFLRGSAGRPVSFSAGLRGDFDIVSTLGQAEVAKSSGSPAASPAASPASSPAASPAALPSSTPHSATSVTFTAKAVATAAVVVRSAFAALLVASKEAMADLLSKLEAAAGVVPDDLVLHRMMVPPSHGPGSSRVDLKVNPTGKVTGGAVSTSVLLPVALLKETHDFMFLSAIVPAGTGCFSFPASLARSVGFDVIQDDVLLATDTGEPIILHVSLKPPYGTPLAAVLDWVSRIEAEPTGRICALKAAAEPLWDADGAAPPTSPLLWTSLAASSLLPLPLVSEDSCNADPLGASASSSAAKLHHAVSIDDCVDPSFALDSDEVVHTAPFPASDAREEVA